MNYYITSFTKLRSYCEKEHFKGWDPYDGLNSRLFQMIPFFKISAILRLIIIQGFKRFPYNVRPLFLIPKEYNAKGIGLFLQGYCNLYKILNAHSQEIECDSREEILQYINYLSELLISLQSKGYNGSCWGYNFDWQARKLFLFPKHTPTVVATCFCSSALISAYEITGEKKYLETALSSAQFVIKDLHRTSCNNGFLFSYSPLRGNDTVYNASLLGSKILSNSYYYTGKKEYKDLARESVLACCEAQAENGSWKYGMLPIQSWIDSFHTGYNLEALNTYQQLTGDISFASNIEKGFDFYINHFFENDGTPKYYHDRMYPIDIHCPGQLLVSLSCLNKFSINKELADKVLNWTISNMQDKKGYFYYQIKNGISSKISYMRWSNAFMFNALTCYLLEVCTMNNIED